MKNLLLSLAICLVVSSLSGQTPVVKEIDGVVYFCYTREQAETLAMKLSEAKSNLKELEASREYIDLLELKLSKMEILLNYDNKIIDIYEEQLKDFEELTNNDSWLNYKPIWVGVGAAGMYLAVKAAASIK